MPPKKKEGKKAEKKKKEKILEDKCVIVYRGNPASPEEGECAPLCVRFWPVGRDCAGKLQKERDKYVLFKTSVPLMRA